MTSFTNPSDEQIKQLLESAKHIAVVGLSPKPDRPSHEVAKHLQDFGYQIIPVRPATDAVLGEKAYASLKDVAGSIDLVDVFLNPSRVDAVIDACIELNIPAIWLQLGVVNEAAALRAQQAGITVIMDKCIYMEHKRLLP
ncbi:MAG: CoA-binding protein [Gammaproteobacteria bacterium]|nr:CoA-binding protein [Gammaproteobacteria bacterium]MDH5776589.1 CoA-binding protein [Gammaproteobacteria bacterium]